MSREGLRRLLHVGTVLVLLVPAVGSWRSLRLLLSAGVPVVLLLEIMRLRNPVVAHHLTRRLPVFRPREAARINGATWLWLGYALASWLPAAAAQGGILAGAIADPAAALVGSRWGGGVRKSWAGTMAACGATVGALLIAGSGWLPAMVSGLAAGALERWSGSLDDNLVLAPGVGTCLFLLS